MAELIYQKKTVVKMLGDPVMSMSNIDPIFWVACGPSTDLFSGRIIVTKISGKFQIVYLCDLKLFIMRISISYQRFGKHK